MKNIICVLVFIFSISTQAQQTIEKTVGEFKTLKVYDLINVKMIQSDQNKVVISGDDKEDVEVINRNGKLKIRMSLGESYDGNDIVVKLYYTSVDTIDANEGANIMIEDTIEQFKIDLKTQEGGKIAADIKVNYANLRAVTGGIIELTGTTKNQDISIYTGGIFEGESCISETSEVSINAGGEAYINVTENIEVKIKAGGDVYIYGNPKRIDEKRVLGGRIKRM